MAVNPDAVGVSVVDGKDIVFGVIVAPGISPLDLGEGVSLGFEDGPLFGSQ